MVETRWMADATSDVDCVLIFEDVDEHIIPGEFAWVPEDDTPSPA